MLVYAKSKESTKTLLLPRDEQMNRRFSNPDNDPDDDWAGKDPTAKEYRANTVYAIQSPFTGYLHYPEKEYTFDGDIPATRKHWTGLSKKEMKHLLEEWGSKYIEKDLGDGRGKALIIKGSEISLTGYNPQKDKAVQKAISLAMLRKNKGNWPVLIFLGSNSEGRPRIKNHLKTVKQGKVPLTYWASDDFESSELIELSSQSWAYTESGHSQTGITELNSIMGPDHGFDTVKPLKLFEKIIQLWCPEN